MSEASFVFAQISIFCFPAEQAEAVFPPCVALLLCFNSFLSGPPLENKQKIRLKAQ